MNWMLVFAGGGLGACARYGLALALPREAGGFPWATLAANVLGSLAIGVAIALLVREPYRLFAVIGVLGGFTTFSSFSLEALQLMETRPVLALAYVLISVCAGLAACWIGMRFYA